MTKERLRSSKELQISVKYHDSKGQARVAGGKDLKGTQSYPPEFGLVVALTHLEYDTSTDVVASDDVRSESSESSDGSVGCIEDLLASSSAA